MLIYCRFLQETYEVLDCICIDNAIDSDYNNSIWSAVNRFNRGTDYTTFTHTALATTYVEISDDVCIEFDIQSDTNYSNSNLLSIRQDNTVLLQTTRSGLNISANEFSHIKIEIKDNECTITNTDTDRSVTGDVTGFNRFYFRIGANESIQFKNLKIYSI